MVDETQDTPDARTGRTHQNDPRRHPHNREQARQTENPDKLKETGLDEEETEEDRSSSHPRPRHGGRPEKKVYEEWANDPYCE